MTKDIFENYEAFYNMLLATTIMSNAQTAEFEADAKKIIKFIGNAYSLPDALVKECSVLILDKLAALGRITDRQAVYNSRHLGDDYTDEDALWDIKGDVLATIQNIGSQHEGYINPGWFDYGHYKTYQPNVRYSKLASTSSTGNLIATRQVGILSAIGIGCKLNYDRAILRLTQCAFWGDIPSMYLLGYVYSLSGNGARSKLFYELADLSKEYLYEGRTVLPEYAKENFSEEARVYYVYISSIKQDIIHTFDKRDIDFSFIEAITSDTLDYYQRMECINTYSTQNWREITNSSEKPAQIIGFN